MPESTSGMKGVGTTGKIKNDHSKPAPHPHPSLFVEEVKAQGEEVGLDKVTWLHRWKLLMRS